MADTIYILRNSGQVAIRVAVTAAEPDRTADHAIPILPGQSCNPTPEAAKAIYVWTLGPTSGQMFYLESN